MIEALLARCIDLLQADQFWSLACLVTPRRYKQGAIVSDARELAAYLLSRKVRQADRVGDGRGALPILTGTVRSEATGCRAAFLLAAVKFGLPLRSLGALLVGDALPLHRDRHGVGILLLPDAKGPGNDGASGAQG